MAMEGGPYDWMTTSSLKYISPLPFPVDSGYARIALRINARLHPKSILKSNFQRVEKNLQFISSVYKVQLWLLIC